MAEKNPAAVALGRLGGLAANANLTPEQKRERTAKATRAAAKKRKREAAERRAKVPIGGDLDRQAN